MRVLAIALLAATSVFAVSDRGLGADLPTKAPVYKAPAVYDPGWTGFYVGLNGGYSWGGWDSTDISSAITSSPKVNGWLGGIQGGYNWQLNTQWVVGIEGDIQITGERASADGSFSTGRIAEPGDDFNDIFTRTTSLSWKFPWFGTLRGRAGYLVDPSLLVYATGGLAVGEFKVTSANAVTCQRFGPGSTGTVPSGSPCSPAPGTPALGGFSFSDNTTRAGFAVGAGIEKRFTPNWSVKLEYLYLDFGNHTFFSGTGFDTNVRLRDQVARLGVNYHF